MYNASIGRQHISKVSVYSSSEKLSHGLKNDIKGNNVKRIPYLQFNLGLHFRSQSKNSYSARSCTIT